MTEFPRALKHLTIWLLLGTALFLGVKAWQARQQAPRLSVAADGAIELKRGPDGHFHWPGSVNGRPALFLVDTGATRSAVPAELARGLEPEGTLRSQTAGGEVQGHWVRAELKLQGGLLAQDWPLAVLPQLATPLLGMDVLSKLQITQAGGVMRLRALRGAEPVR